MVCQTNRCSIIAYTIFQLPLKRWTSHKEYLNTFHLKNLVYFSTKEDFCIMPRNLPHDQIQFPLVYKLKILLVSSPTFTSASENSPNMFSPPLADSSSACFASGYLSAIDFAILTHYIHCITTMSNTCYSIWKV